MSAPSSSALGVSRASGFVPNSYSSESWSQSDWYNAAQSWNQMLSSTNMTPLGLQKALSEIGEKAGNAIEEGVNTGNRTSGKNEHRGVTAQNFGGAKKNAVAMQDKTGSYGQKRKPGDYLR